MHSHFVCLILVATLMINTVFGRSPRSIASKNNVLLHVSLRSHHFLEKWVTHLVDKISILENS